METNKKSKFNPKAGRPIESAQIIKTVNLVTGHKIEYMIGQIVFLRMDNEQQPRLCTGISLRPNRSVTYCLGLGTSESWHYGIEISDERDVLKATGI